MNAITPLQPQVLETACEWTAEEVSDPAVWTERLSPVEIDELDAAVKHAFDVSADFMRIGKAEFPLPTLAPRLKRIENDLINGRGFALLRGLPRERWTNDEMSMAYWGIGAHLGKPWPQNAKGHLLGDVTDQGKLPGDPTARGNELGQIGLGLPLRRVRPCGPALPAERRRRRAVRRLQLRRPAQPAGAGAAGTSRRNSTSPSPSTIGASRSPESAAGIPCRCSPAHGDRLFVRLIRPYVLASQRHADAPRLTDRAIEALAWMQEMAESNAYAVIMDFQPGDMQFINNYHVLHGRTAYVDDRAAGQVRHLKRLWLETEVLEDRPEQFNQPHGRPLGREGQHQPPDAASA